MTEPTQLDNDLAALKSQKATWQTDGKGIRGDVVEIKNTAANLVWESSRPASSRAPVDLPA
jgi:hypothetical protein